MLKVLGREPERGQCVRKRETSQHAGCGGRDDGEQDGTDRRRENQPTAHAHVQPLSPDSLGNGIVDRKFTLKPVVRDKGWSKQNIGNFLYMLESNSQQVRVTRVKLTPPSSSRKSRPHEIPPDLWTYDIEKKEFRKLSQGEHEERWPMWAPDGKRAYVVSQVDGTFNLYELQLAGGKRRKLTQFEDDGVAFPAISRDGSTIVFRRLFDLYRSWTPN